MRRWLKRKVRRFLAFWRLHDMVMARLRRDDPELYTRLILHQLDMERRLGL